MLDTAKVKSSGGASSLDVCKQYKRARNVKPKDATKGRKRLTRRQATWANCKFPKPDRRPDRFTPLSTERHTEPLFQNGDEATEDRTPYQSGSVIPKSRRVLGARSHFTKQLHPQPRTSMDTGRVLAERKIEY